MPVRQSHPVSLRTVMLHATIALAFAGFAAPGHASGVEVSVSSSSSMGQVHGPFAAQSEASTASQRRSKHSVDSHSEESASIPGASASVDGAGLATVSTSFSNGECNNTPDCQHTFESYASAQWGDTWYVVPEDGQLVGTTARMRVTLELDGRYLLKRDLSSEVQGSLQLAKATLAVNGITMSLNAAWTNDAQHLTISEYVDFRYEYAGGAGLSLRSTESPGIGRGELTGSESFSARISEILVPMGASIYSSIGFNVINSTDPNLYPNAPVPEPSTYALLILGLCGVAARTTRPRGRKQ